MYNIIAIAGKSGSGKSTLLHEVIAAAPDRFHEIVSCTTRPPREGEVDGKNYYFINLDDFYYQVGHSQMLESTLFNGWGYGTPVSSLVEDKVNIGVFNPAGLRSLAASPQVSLAIVYVHAEDKIRLLRQLNREENPDVHEIIRRFEADEKDFKAFENLENEPETTLIVNNNKIDLAFAVDVVMDLMVEAFGQN